MNWGDIGLLALTSLGLILFCEYLIRTWTRQADRRHWDKVRQRLDESRW